MNVNIYNLTVLGIVILLVWIPWLWRYKVKPFLSNRVLQKKLKQYPHWKPLMNTEFFLWSLYKGSNTTRLSKQERKRLAIDDDAFTYGEIEFLPFYTMLNQVNPQPTDIFYDLGSGAGKAVFVAASFFQIKKACGIELLPGLYNYSTSLIDKAINLAKTHAQQLSDIEFIQGDFLNTNISNGDIIFINATCLSFSSWEKILSKLLGLKQGSRVIVTSKKINHETFQLINETFAIMSWGLNSVNIYQKI